MKRNRLLYSICLILLAMTCFLVYENNELSKQIEERDIIFEKSNSLDKVLDSLIVTRRTDSIGVIYFRRNENGGIISYSELDSALSACHKELMAKDAILLKAKQIYKFDYSYKYEGDSIVVFRFFEKQKLNN